MIDTIFVPAGAEATVVRRAVTHAGAPVRVLETGVGPRAAARAADDAIAAGRFGTALITGLCGLLSPAFTVGDALVYREIRTPSGEPLALDGDFARTVAERISHPQTGIRALASDDVVISAERKRDLGRRFGVEAVDMESHALTERLQRAGVSVAVVRVASDGVDDDLPELDRALNGSGGIDAAALGLALVRRPLLGARLTLNATRALRALGRALAGIVRG